MASSGGSRARLTRLAALLAAAVLVDLALSATWLRDGVALGRPLPPFGAITQPAQLDALVRLESAAPSSVSVTHFDRELGWCVRPLAAHENGDYAINAAGQRGRRDYARSKPTGVVRLACFGDSFTFGDEVRDAWTYESMLEGLEPTVEALNFGVPAFGTDQALLRFRREGRWDADVVVVGLLLENVGRNVNRYRPLWYPRSHAPLVKPRFVLGEGDALELVAQPYASGPDMAAAIRSGRVLDDVAAHEHWLGKPSLGVLRHSAFARLLGGFLAYRVRDPERLWRDPSGEPRRVTVALLEAFRREALESGAARCVVLLFPMKEELAEFLRSGESYWKPLCAELDRRGIPYVDLIPPLAVAQRECERNPKIGTVYVASHLSSVGNLAVARALRAWLARQRLLGG